MFSQTIETLINLSTLFRIYAFQFATLSTNTSVGQAASEIVHLNNPPGLEGI